MHFHEAMSHGGKGGTVKRTRQGYRDKRKGISRSLGRALCGVDGSQFRGQLANLAKARPGCRGDDCAANVSFLTRQSDRATQRN